MVNESHLIPTHDDSHWWEFVVRQGRACSVLSLRQSRIIVTGPGRSGTPDHSLATSLTTQVVEVSNRVEKPEVFWGAKPRGVIWGHFYTQ